MRNEVILYCLKSNGIIDLTSHKCLKEHDDYKQQYIMKYSNAIVSVRKLIGSIWYKKEKTFVVCIPYESR